MSNNGQISTVKGLNYGYRVGYDTIRYTIFTCAQKLTRWPA